MGCDIHEFIETRLPDGSWTSSFTFDDVEGYIERMIADGTAHTATGTSDDAEARERFTALLAAMSPEELGRLEDQIKRPFEVPNALGWRNYGFFYALAGVRYRDGCAQLWEPRGVPPDLSPDVEAAVEDWSSDGHSHSWQMISELLAAPGMQVFESQFKAFQEIATKVDPENTRFVYFFDN